ncbi:MAG: hypothetical protein QOC80_615 [Frankiaceae bacterium]|nr:hypothetical protein [Frankiaceae bacterium]
MEPDEPVDPAELDGRALAPVIDQDKAVDWLSSAGVTMPWVVEEYERKYTGRRPRSSGGRVRLNLPRLR